MASFITLPNTNNNLLKLYSLKTNSICKQFDKMTWLLPIVLVKCVTMVQFKFTVQALKCENLVLTCIQWPHRVPRQDPDTLVAGRKDRVCVILPFYLTTIFHCSVTFTSSLPSRQVSHSPLETLCLDSSVLIAMDQPDSQQPWPNLTINVKSFVCLFHSCRLLPILFPKPATMTSSHCHFSAPWPFLSRRWTMHVLVQPDPQTQTMQSSKPPSVQSQTRLKSASCWTLYLHV